MLVQSTKSLIWALSLATLAHCLPGRPVPAPRQCSDGADNLYGTLCSADISSITAAPAPQFSFNPKNAVISVTCGLEDCSVFDVSASLVKVVPAGELTAAPSSSISSTCIGNGCPWSVPLVTGETSGTGSGPEPSSISRGPFANSTDGSLTYGPTGTGTGRVSGTGVSSAEANSTTIVHSTITLSVTTFTDSAPWSAWTNWPGAGTGPSSGFPASPTMSGPFSNTTSPSPSATLVSSTFVSAGQTFTTQVPVSSQSYVSTATYIFSGITIEIPIPDSYTNTLPDTGSSATTSPIETTAPSTTSVSQGSDVTISTSSCRTTTEYASTGTGVTAAVARSTLICWGIECIDNVCHDFVDRTPLTANAVATSTGPSTNGTGPTSVSASPTSTGLIYATDDTEPSQPTDRPSSVWPSSNSTRNPDAYTDTATGASMIAPTAAQVLATNLAAVALYTFTATDSAGNAFTTTYNGELPASWIDAPSDSSALVSELSSASVAATATTSRAATSETTDTAPSTFAWAAWSSTVSASATPISTTSLTTANDNTVAAQPTPAAETDVGSDGALIHGGKSQRRRAGIKAVRAEKRSTKDVKDPGLDRIAAEAKRMEMNEVDPDHYGSGNVIDVKCDGIWCWLWR